MISIIKHGTRHECTCERCWCVFTFEEEDTFIGNKIKSNGNFEQSVRCPECQNRIEVYLDE